jgi:hypothetical protein
LQLGTISLSNQFHIGLCETVGYQSLFLSIYPSTELYTVYIPICNQPGVNKLVKTLERDSIQEWPLVFSGTPFFSSRSYINFRFRIAFGDYDRTDVALI